MHFSLHVRMVGKVVVLTLVQNAIKASLVWVLSGFVKIAPKVGTINYRDKRVVKSVPQVNILLKMASLLTVRAVQQEDSTNTVDRRP